MMAAVADVGSPSVSSGTSVPAAAALFAASGPATPSIAPLPNAFGSRASRRSSAYDRNVGISDPPAGSTPPGNPSAVPRSQGRHERDQSSRVIQIDPRSGITDSGSMPVLEAANSDSPTANRPTATITTSMPLRNWVIP